MIYHPITPPPELVEQWRNLPEYVSQLRTMSTITITTEKLQHIATQAARWGADQQLAMDANWLDHNALNEPHLQIIPMGESLKETMRLKRPNLKEQALIELNDVYNRDRIDDVTYDTIRYALEQLNDIPQ
jgi:hypothetical protein